MDLDFTLPRAYINSYWLARAENPSQLAGRLGGFIDRLATIDTLLSDPIVAESTNTRYAQVRHKLSTLIAQKVSRDEWGMSVKEGYAIAVRWDEPTQPFECYGFVGRDLPLGDCNNLSFTTGMGIKPNTAALSHALYRSVMLATIECWEPTACYAQPSTLAPFVTKRRLFAEAWIAYVPPRLRHLVAPADVPLVETTQDGGLLLSATTDLFDPTNPAHLEGARCIARATCKLNDAMPVF